VEKARHVLLLREKLSEHNRTQDLTKLDKDAVNKFRRQGHAQGHDRITLSEKERERSRSEMEKSSDDLDSVLDTSSSDPSTALIVKCLRLMLLNSRMTARSRATLQLSTSSTTTTGVRTLMLFTYWVSNRANCNNGVLGCYITNLT